jgi:hypothetical protein
LRIVFHGVTTLLLRLVFVEGEAVDLDGEERGVPDPGVDDEVDCGSAVADELPLITGERVEAGEEVLEVNLSDKAQVPVVFVGQQVGENGLHDVLRLVRGPAADALGQGTKHR